MFTGEEIDFIKHDPMFIEILRGMTDQEIIAFRELVVYICNLSPDERRMLFTRVNEVLMEMKRPMCHFQ